MIPTYGQAQFLGKALDSALAQDYPNLEVVVSDDASPDGTPELMSLYADEPRVRYVRSPSNRGRVLNYRHTLENLARGDYALNLDGDDWLCDPSYISDAVELIAHHSELVMVFARSSVYDESLDSYHEVRRNVDLPVVNDGTGLLRGYAENSVSIPHMTALYHRASALEVGFYEANVLGTDSVALLSLLPGRSVGFIDRVVGVWRKHARNATWDPDVAERVRNFAIADIPAAIAQRTGALNPAAAKRWRRDMAVVLAQSFVEDCLAGGRVGAATRFMVSTFGRRPGVSALVVNRLVRKGMSRLRSGSR
jgi:glycosyltransferase involved in cell wall biosynthesis